MKNLPFFVIFFVAACSDPYAGFDEIEEGLYFKLNELGTESSVLNKADFVLMAFDFCEDSDCKIVELQRSLLINMAGKHIDKDFWSERHLGDRFTLLYENEHSGFVELFSIPDSVSISYPVIIVCSPEASHSFNSYTGDSLYFDRLMQFREMALIDSWLIEEGGYEFDSSGVYIKVTKTGTGDSVAIDREIALSYKAYFRNGLLFDDTDNWEEPFKYVVGIPNQIISGLGIGIDGLREGSEAKIIIPSHLAFRETGSSTGLVPPYEPLKYEVKIIDIKVD